jgi:hypothetical protein
VVVNQVRKTTQEIQVNCADPKGMRRELAINIGPELGIQFRNIRKTKKDGFALEIVQDNVDETYIVRIKKGGDFRAGRANEIGLQDFIRQEIEKKGHCKLDVSDRYGTNVKLDIVEVIDASKEHGEKGKVNRSDTTVRLKDGSLYGISQKQENASIICGCKKMFHDIMWRCGQVLRQYAIEHGMKKGDYMDIRVTNRELIDLCWFGSDISKNSHLAGGAVFMGNFMGMTSGKQTIERIVQVGDTDFLNSFPIYTKWLIENSHYTMEFKGVYCKNCKWIIDDIELTGVNAPMPNGKKFRTGDEEKKKRRKRRKKRVNEDLLSEEQMMEEARQNDMWDTVAWCAENHKMLWLKYETVEDGSIISRKVAPYSYRTRNTKVRGRSTYFYADDFTPGQEHGIKCFLIENCLQVKESKQSFTPRWDVEIKQEIDRLEKQRQDKEREKPEEEPDKEIVKPEPEKPKEKPEPRPQEPSTPEKPVGKDEPSNPEQKVEPKSEPKKPSPPPKAEPVKVSEPVEKPPKPEPKEKEPPPPPPEKEEPVEKQNPEPPKPEEKSDDEVTVTDEPEEPAKKPDTDEIQVTDDDGNAVNEKWLRIGK